MLQKAAIAYTKQNDCRPPLSIFPLAPRKKRPLQDGGFYNATTDVDKIKAYWKQWPDANIGIRPIGFIILDIDNHDPNKNGFETIKEWEQENEPLPITPTVLTGSGGEQRYFKTDNPLLTKGENIGPGIDYRGSLGYGILPPSVHPNGNLYEWDAGSLPSETPMADLPKWLEQKLLSATANQNSNTTIQEIPEVLESGERNAHLFRIGCGFRSKGMTEDEIYSALLAVNNSRCKPGLSKNEIRSISKSCIKYQKGKLPNISETKSGIFSPPKDFSDAGNAESFASFVKENLLWCDALGWLVWNGKNWETNEHKATRLAINFAQTMLKDALKQYSQEVETNKQSEELVIPDNIKQYLSHAKKSRSAVSIQRFLALSKSYLNIKAEKLDSEWWNINTDAGIIDLRTGEIKPHDPKALCTKIAPYSPSSEDEKLWLDFLNLVTNQDPDLQSYLKVKIGSYAYGKIHYEGVEFAVGNGRNGKSTLYNAISKILGDYAGGIDSIVLTTDRQNRGAALATLRGKRLVICGELEEGQRLSVQTLKRIASTDPLTIEEKFRQPETIQPSHHIVLFSNFLPKVGSTDDGTWRRLSVIPFNAIMPAGNAEIPDYASELADKAGGAILAWIIEGAKQFYQSGYHITLPDSIIEATNDYKQREDWLKNYLMERCIRDPNARVKCSELYNDYKSYAISNGDYCRRNADFSHAVENAGFKKVFVNGRPLWIGLRINYALDYGDPPPQARYS